MGTHIRLLGQKWCKQHQFIIIVRPLTFNRCSYYLFSLSLLLTICIQFSIFFFQLSQRSFESLATFQESKNTPKGMRNQSSQSVVRIHSVRVYCRITHSIYDRAFDIEPLYLKLEIISLSFQLLFLQHKIRAPDLHVYLIEI